MRRLFLPLLLLPFGLLMPSGCSGEVAEPPTSADQATAARTPAGQAAAADDEVGLSLYFRSGEGAHAHLERVTRRVAVGDNLLREALELLVAGPAEDESGLAATLPPTTQVHVVEASGGVAHVVLSADVVRDASIVGGSPANEALALAAITNTLTDFPSVEEVRLEIEGSTAPGEFWGGWGLPATLVRDESLIGAQGSGEGVPDLGRFSNEPQSTGSDDAGGVVLSALRVRDRLTHVRIMVELASPEGKGPASAKVPRVHAWSTSEEILLDLSGVQDIASGLEELRGLSISDPAFRALGLRRGERSTTVRLTVDDAPERRYWLHSMTGPTRIVLDVKK